MTTKQKLISMLVANGMFESQAEKVMEIAIKELKTIDEDYKKISWDRTSEEYPDKLYSFWFGAIKPIAYKWIEENLPQAWFKEMFK